MSDINSIRACSSEIRSLRDFENISGKENVFVRIIGENNSFFNDFLNFENRLCGDMSNGKIAYKRVTALTKLVSVDDVNYYSQCYDSWLRSYKKKAVIRATENNAELSSLLANAITECLGMLKKTRPQLTPAMEKNFAVKLLFWFDSVTADLVGKIGFNSCVKIVAENVVKIQEYLFFYLLALTDFNVLLLENKCDIDNNAKKLDLSVGSVIGHLGTSVIPPYTECNVASYNNSFSNANNNHQNNSKQQSNGNIRVTIPPRPKKAQNENSQGITSGAQPSGNIKVTIPPRPSRTQSVPSQGTAVQPQQGGNVRVTVPPGPTKQRDTAQNTNAIPQQSGNVRITLPPRPGSQNPSRSVPPVTSAPPQQGRNMRITTPSRPNPPISIPQNRTAASALPQQPRTEKSYEELAQLASSIVLVYILKRKPFGKEEGEVVGTGSGIMIGESGYILTNCHVARAGTAYGIRLENEEKIYFTDELIKYHSDLDLAIIRIDRALKPLKIYKGPQGLVRGQRVVAIGSPLGLFNTVSDGIISGFRNVDGVDMIQFTAPISHGSSGGAVLNMYGEVVGISTAGLDDGQNINLAVGYEAINNFIGNFI